jgi:hypothetical protein
VDASLTHVWCGHRVSEWRGRVCRIVKSYRGKMLLEFADGKRVLTMRGNLRKAKR